MRNCETRIRETSVKRLRFQALTRDFARESLYNSAFARPRDAPHILREWHEEGTTSLLCTRKTDQRAYNTMHTRILDSYLCMRYTRVNKGSPSREQASSSSSSSQNVFQRQSGETEFTCIILTLVREKQGGEGNILCVKKKIYKARCIFIFEISLAWPLCVRETIYSYFFMTRLGEEKIIASPRRRPEFKSSADLAPFISQQDAYINPDRNAKILWQSSFF